MQMPRSHVNAWPDFEAWLRVRCRTQSELADLLNVSSSAVSKIKKGDILLRAEQIRMLIDILKIDENGVNAIYSSIFHARFINGAFGDSDAPCRFRIERENAFYPPISSRSRALPCVRLADMAWYESALEDISDFIRRRNRGNRIVSGSGDFLVEFDEPRSDFALPVPSLIALNCSRKIRTGDTILAKITDGKLAYGRLECSPERLVLIPAGRPEAPKVWRCGIDVNLFYWAYSVSQIIISRRVGRTSPQC